MVDANGNIIMEEKEIEIPLFRPVKVFDGFLVCHIALLSQ